MSGGMQEWKFTFESNVKELLKDVQVLKEKTESLEKSEHKIHLDIDTKALDSAMKNLDKMLKSLGSGSGDFKQFDKLASQMESITSDVQNLSKAFGTLGNDKGAKSLLDSINNIDSSLQKLTGNLGNVKIAYEEVDVSIEKVAKSIEKVKPVSDSKLKDKLFNESLNNMFPKQISDAKAKLSELNAELAVNKSKLESNEISQEAYNKSVEIYNDKINATIKSLNNLQKLGSGTVVGKAENIKSLEQARSEFQSYAESIGKVKKEMQWSQDPTKGGLYKMTMQVVDANGQIQNLSANWSESSKTVISQTKVMGKEVGSFAKIIDQFSKKWIQLTEYMAAMFLNPFVLFGKLKTGVEYLKEFDSGLTTVSYTMDITKSKIDDLGESILQMSNNMKTSVSDAMDVAQIYANMNTTAEEIQKLSEPTLILSNLTGSGASTAADQIQAVTQQFEIAAEESMHIADVYDYISRNIAVDYSKILELILEIIYRKQIKIGKG